MSNFLKRFLLAFVIAIVAQILISWLACMAANHFYGAGLFHEYIYLPLYNLMDFKAFWQGYMACYIFAAFDIIGKRK